MTYFQALKKAFRVLAWPEFWRWIALSVILSAALLGLLGYGAIYELTSTRFVTWTWLEWLVDILSGVAVLAVLLFLFPALAGALAGLFADQVVDLIERREAPHLPPARSRPWTEDILSGLRLFGIMLAVNIVTLPFLFFLPFVPVLVNGYLLGREYFQVIAQRRLSWPDIQKTYHLNKYRVWGAGLVIAGISYIPVLNLVAPIVGLAFMTHVFKQWNVGEGGVT